MNTAAFLNSKLALFATNIINPILLLLFALATLVFIYGIWEYFFKDVEGSDRKAGANHILWGSVGFVIMLGAYGIIYIILNTTGVSSEFNTQYQSRTPITIQEQ